MAIRHKKVNTIQLPQPLTEAWLLWPNAETEINHVIFNSCGKIIFLFVLVPRSCSGITQQGWTWVPPHAHTAQPWIVVVYLMLMASSGVKQAVAECVSNNTWFILRNINSQSELFASSYVKAQTVVIWRGEEMHDSAESAVWAGLWRCATALLHHHPPVNQIHPTHVVKNIYMLYMHTCKHSLLSLSALNPGLSELVNQILAIKVTVVIHPLLPHETKIQCIPKDRQPVWVSYSQVTRLHKTRAVQRSVVVITRLWSVYKVIIYSLVKLLN